MNGRRIFRRGAKMVIQLLDSFWCIMTSDCIMSVFCCRMCYCSDLSAICSVSLCNDLSCTPEYESLEAVSVQNCITQTSV